MHAGESSGDLARPLWSHGEASPDYVNGKTEHKTNTHTLFKTKLTAAFGQKREQKRLIN